MGTGVYLGSSIFDAGVTILHSALDGEYIETNPIARSLLESYHYAGMGIALGIEYASMIIPIKILPKKLRPVPKYGASFIHTLAGTGHVDDMTGSVPKGLMDVHDFVIFNMWRPAMEKLVEYGQNLYDIGNRIV